MADLTIGEFGERTRLSGKALRIYDELGLLVPARVDPVNGYRYYSEAQIERGRLVSLLRRLEMPLAEIARIVDLPPEGAAEEVRRWWDGVEGAVAERRALARYLQQRLRGEEHRMYDIAEREVAERAIASISRHVDVSGMDAFFDEAFSTLRSLGPGLPGLEGAPFLIFYGEVSDDGDGPVELARPIALERPGAPEGAAGVEFRREPRHDEAAIPLTKGELSWPAMLPAYDALERWVAEHGRSPAGPVRQVLLADQRTATSVDVVCDLVVPLR